MKWFIYLTNWGFLIFCVALLVRAGTATYCYFNKGESAFVTVTDIVISIHLTPNVFGLSQGIIFLGGTF